MSYYLADADRIAERVRKEAPQMRVERLDYGYGVIVSATESGITKAWTLMQPEREHMRREIKISDDALTKLIAEWNDHYSDAKAAHDACAQA